MKMSNMPALLGLLFCCTIYGQIKIGDNPQIIDPSSVLELESRERVLVITRVTTAEMNAIMPLRGALVYNTDVQCVHYYDGTQWVNLCENNGSANITADPIIHDIPTIALTPSADGTNIEIAENSIRSEMIVDGGINGVDIQNGSIGPGKLQNNSVTQDKLSENAVGAFALDNANIGLTDFTNDAGFITNANIVSAAANNAITNNGGAFYDNSPVLNAVNDNTILINNHIAADADTNVNNEIQSLTLTGNSLSISGSNTVTFPNITGEIDNNELITNAVLSGTDLIITDPGQTWTIPLASLGGSNGADGSIIDPNGGTNINITGAGTQESPYVINSTFTEVDGSPTNELITASVLNGNILTITEGGNPFDIDLTGLGGGSGTQNLTNVLTQGNDAGNTIITNLGSEPTDPTSAATVGYVNNAIIGGGTPLEFDNSTISGSGAIGDPYTVADEAITRAKIATATDGATAGQILKVNVGGNGVDWVDPTVFVDATLTGDGTTPATALSIADGAITTDKILDQNVTPPKIQPSATDGQVLTTSGGTVQWATATAGAVGTGTTIDGDGTVGNELEVADNAITSAMIVDGTIVSADIATDGVTNTNVADGAITTDKILDQNVTPPKIQPSATDGQVLTTVGGTAQWAAATSGQNLFDADLPLASTRTHNLDGNNFNLNGPGFVGIGTDNPTNKLHVDGAVRAEGGFRSTFGTLPGSVAYSFYNDSDTGMYRAGADQLAFSTGGAEAMRIDGSQNVGIGPKFASPIDDPIDARLHVDGDIYAEGDFYSTLGTGVQPIPDYVFEYYFLGRSELKENYNFKSLEEIENFVKKNHHLPGIKSAATAMAEGKWNLGESNIQNLEKIEELFLHTIEQENKIKQLQKENQTISNELIALKKELEVIKNLIKKSN